jgi:hypothetical protein
MLDSILRESPLWDDPLVRVDFFRCAGVCRLHVITLGLFKRALGIVFLLMPQRQRWAAGTFAVRLFYRF